MPIDYKLSDGFGANGLKLNSETQKIKFQNSQSRHATVHLILLIKNILLYK